MNQSKHKTPLQKILKKKSLSQKELREKINLQSNKGDSEVVAATLSRIVTGKQKNYTVKTLIKISRALNVSTDEILENDINLVK